MTQPGPAIQPTPPSCSTSSGMCAEALNTLTRSPMRLSMVRMRPVLPEASLTYSMLGRWDKASSTSIGMSPPRRPGLVYSVIEVCGSDLGNGGKIALDTPRRQREHLLQDQDQPVCAEPGVRLRLPHGIAGGKRRDARQHRHAPGRGIDHDAHDLLTLLEREIGELAGAAQGREPVHAAGDQMFDQLAQHALAHAPRGFVDRGNEVGENSVKVGHARVTLDWVNAMNAMIALFDAAAVARACGLASCSVQRNNAHFARKSLTHD